MKTSVKMFSFTKLSCYYIIISLDAKRGLCIQSRIGQKAAVKEHFVLQNLTKS
jgi:hypothetical protein